MSENIYLNSNLQRNGRKNETDFCFGTYVSMNQTLLLLLLLLLLTNTFWFSVSLRHLK